MIVEVKPIERESWHNKVGKESFARPKIICARVNPSTHEYETGLTQKDIDHLKEVHKIVYDLSSQYTKNVAHPFWDSSVASIKLENTTQFFDTDNPIDYIKVKIMKASPYVANSEKAYLDGDFPRATHFISDESAELNIKATRVAVKKKAIIEASKLTSERKIQILMILDGKNAKGKSDDYLEVSFDTLIEEKASEVLDLIQNNVEDTAAHALVLEALQKSVLIKQGHKIVYMDSTIGNSVVDATNYLNELENQELKLRIIASLTE